MTFLGLFKKKEQEVLPIDTNLEPVPTSVPTQPMPDQISSDSAAELQAEDEEAPLLGAQSETKEAQPTSSEPIILGEMPIPGLAATSPSPASAPLEKSISTPSINEAKPAQQEVPETQVLSQHKEIKEMGTLRKETVPDIVAYPGAPGSGKIFEGIYVRKERYIELLESLRDNRVSLQEQLSNEERLLQLQEKIVHNLEKEESLLNELFEKVMTMELLTKRC